MKKFIFLSCFIGLSFIAVVGSSTSVNADEINSSSIVLNEIGIQEIAPQATLTKYWSDGWVKTGNPAPAVALFRKGAYRGWLSKYRDLPQPFGTLGYYSGYLYHDSLPLPSPARVIFPEDQNESVIYNGIVEVD